MNKFKSPIPLWAGYPLLFVLGVGTGIIASGYEWSSNGYRLLPSEVIITPPPPNVTWCFPNTSLRTAVQVRTALAGKLHEDPAFSSVDSTQVAAVIKQLNNEPQVRGWYPITLLRQQNGHYEILVQGITGGLTLATEEGTFYLHQIPERFHEKYDSLVQARHR